MDDNQAKKTTVAEKLKTMAHDKRIVAVTLLAVIIATYIMTCVTFVFEDQLDLLHPTAKAGGFGSCFHVT